MASSSEEQAAVAQLGGGAVRVGASGAGDGRGLFACRAFAEGELVLSEPAFCSALDGRFGAWECCCHGCLQREDEEEHSACAACGWARWCSARCEAAVRAQHGERECAAMQRMRYAARELAPRALLASRLEARVANSAGAPSSLLASGLVGEAGDVFGHALRCELEAAVADCEALGTGPGAMRVLARLARNDFRIQDERGVTVAAALFPLAARLQHACGDAANLAPSRAEDQPWTLRLEALRPIGEGEELTFCYARLDEAGGVEGQRRRLREQYGFECGCSACRQGG